MVMDYRALRAVIGVIAFVLVPVVYIANWVLFTRHVGTCFWPNPRIPGSLSAFYYTHMRNLFVGAMCAMGLFFAAYRGYSGWDNWFTNAAGVAAICIGLFPTRPPQYVTSPKGPNQFFTPSNLCGPTTLITYHESPDQRLIGYVHIVSLFVLIAMVFFMVLVQFTKTRKPDTGTSVPEVDAQSAERWNPVRRFLAWWKSLSPRDPRHRKKKLRNQIYVLCAGGILLCALLAGVTAFWPSALPSGLLYAESGAFVFFGFAWYIKGAASVPVDHKQLLGRVLAWPVRGLTDPRGESPGGSGPVAAPPPSVPEPQPVTDQAGLFDGAEPQPE
jgi:hypothetical protein